MIPRPPRPTRTDTPCPYTTLFRAVTARIIVPSARRRESATRRPVESLPPEAATRSAAGLRRLSSRRRMAVSGGRMRGAVTWGKDGRGLAAETLLFGRNLVEHGARRLGIALRHFAHGGAGGLGLVECGERHAELEQHFGRFRSEESRVGKEGVGTGTLRGSLD